MIRIRFDGLAFPPLSPAGHPVRLAGKLLRRARRSKWDDDAAADARLPRRGKSDTLDWHCFRASACHEERTYGQICGRARRRACRGHCTALVPEQSPVSVARLPGAQRFFVNFFLVWMPSFIAFIAVGASIMMTWEKFERQTEDTDLGQSASVESPHAEGIAPARAAYDRGWASLQRGDFQDRHPGVRPGDRPRSNRQLRVHRAGKCLRGTEAIRTRHSRTMSGRSHAIRGAFRRTTIAAAPAGCRRHRPRHRGLRRSAPVAAGLCSGAPLARHRLADAWRKRPRDCRLPPGAFACDRRCDPAAA